MRKILRVFAVLVTLYIGGPAALAWGQALSWRGGCLIGVSCLDIDIWKPKTRAGIQRSYHWFVSRKDGINRKEARILAQYWVSTEYEGRKMDFRKPRVLWETDETWGMRFPGKFNLTTGKAHEYLVCIDKKSGAVTCQEEVVSQR